MQESIKMMASDLRSAFSLPGHCTERTRTVGYRAIRVPCHLGTEPSWYIGNSQVIKREFGNCEVVISI